MRIWHKPLIKYLCRQHLLATWREGLGCYDIITCERITVNGKQYRKYCHKCGTENTKYKRCVNCGKILNGYFNHPQTKEFENNLPELLHILYWTRYIMVKRHYKPKPIPTNVPLNTLYRLLYSYKPYKPWQTLEQQIEILRAKKAAKKCDCQISLILEREKV